MSSGAERSHEEKRAVPMREVRFQATSACLRGVKKTGP